MPQVGRADAEFQRNAPNPATMSEHAPCDPTPSAEGRARAEWHALLQRMQAEGSGDHRLQRLRHAIASGEFQVDACAIAERLIARLLMS